MWYAPPRQKQFLILPIPGPNIATIPTKAKLVGFSVGIARWLANSWSHSILSHVYLMNSNLHLGIAALQKQIKERQDKIKLLHELQQEEVHLQSLIARKRALTIPTFQVCNLLAYSIQDIKKKHLSIYIALLQHVFFKGFYYKFFTHPNKPQQL